MHNEIMDGRLLSRMKKTGTKCIETKQKNYGVT